MRLDVGGLSDKGMERDLNEDALFVGSSAGIFAVADGVGGAIHGEVASAMFAEAVREWSRGAAAARDRTGDDTAARRGILASVQKLFDQASRRIFEFALANRDHRGMCTTGAVMTTVDEDEDAWAVIGHVGDTRVYLIRDGKLHRLTSDHTFAQELLQGGLITEEELRTSTHRHVLSRAVGKYPTVKVDMLWVDLVPGDLYLMCTDGLTDLVEDRELLEMTRGLEAGEIVSRLVATANGRGGHDNITVVAVRVLGEQAEEPSIEATQRVTFLRDLKLFEGMSEQEILWFLKVVYIEVKRPREVVIREGDQGGDMYIVEDGELDVMKEGRVLTTVRKGDHFGELAIFDRQPRSATVVARTRSTLFRIPGDDLHRMTETEPALATRVLWRLMQYAATRIRDLSARVV